MGAGDVSVTRVTVGFIMTRAAGITNTRTARASQRKVA